MYLRGYSMKRTYTGTRVACYIGYFVQAIINCLSPVLFIVYQTELSLSYSQLSMLVLVNFLTQLCVDLLSARYVDRIGYRRAITLAHILAAAGLILLAVLPRRMGNAFAGLLIPTVVYAFGSGLIEVLISPIVDSLPSDSKSAGMSLLHSFYCWGQLAVVLITTLLLRVIGTANWVVIPLLWAVVPVVNLFNFLTVPLVPPVAEEKKTPLCRLLHSGFFLAAMLLMLTAGAAEQAMSQWASLFAETSLHVSKVVGDILGPCLFAALMGSARLFYGLMGAKIQLRKALTVSAALCVAAYLLAALAPWPIVSLLGCGLCGLSVGLMWPGVFSLTSAQYAAGGTTMFAVLAVFGDLGCAFGPWLTGEVSAAAEAANSRLSGLSCGLLAALVFPILMLVLLRMQKRSEKSVSN